MKALRFTILFWLLCFACVSDLQEEFHTTKEDPARSIIIVPEITNPLTPFIF